MAGERSQEEEEARFAEAEPVWLAGREREMNLQVGFRAVVGGDLPAPVVLRATASAVYRATVNGQFVGYGPARAAHGWFRVDEWDLTSHLRAGVNVIGLEVAGYNANSYYLLDQPSFLQAEVLSAGKVIAATGEGRADFAAAPLAYRLQRVARYSFQRVFSEAYRLGPADLAWRQASDLGAQWGARTAAQPAVRLLPRRVAAPDFRVCPATAQVGVGRFQRFDPPVEPWRGRFVTDVGPDYKGFPESELEENPSIEMQRLRFEAGARDSAMPAALCLSAGEYCLLDFGVNLTGFARILVKCQEQTRLLLAFDEVLTDGDVDFKRLGCVNLISYQLAPGAYELESFEPYTLRYLKLMVLEGRCGVEDPAVRTYACGNAGRAEFAAADPRLAQLFEAGRETFRQNAVDIFMDCPSRERAGWLCDSFFTARAALDLTGETSVERNFIENYLLPETFPGVEDGMLPMCYPAEHRDGTFIPNWAMWFVIQLEEYLARTGDRETVRKLRPRVSALLSWLSRFRNEDGLLERLPSWVFIEWSAANDFVQDVSYPSNMLYAGTLDAAARMYGAAEWAQEAEALRRAIRRRSFDGEFFVDNAIRDGDALRETRNRTETCQYYAFYFDVATREDHPDLWRKLVTEFGPRRAERGLYPEVHPSNSFIGNMLRAEVLSRAGLAQQQLDESADYLLYMAERTGTLWENVDAGASCNHGFASHICHTLFRDILGVRKLDRVNRRVVLRFPRLEMDWCAGALPVEEGEIRLRWERKGEDEVAYSLAVPSGYIVTVEDTPGLAVAAAR